MQLLTAQQRAVCLHLPHQSVDLGVTLLDQVDKLSNHACALCSVGCELLVLICEISAGSGVTGNLGVLGGGGAQVVLQACNAGSISSAASFQPLDFLGVCMGVVLLRCGVLQSPCRFGFCSCLRLLCLGQCLF
ncbi:hypothetical protein AX13_05000 [Comamonas aquatica DA1877]|uniref:Uncharacterized protein n=1 Tax=Comamonas aquatica DA1877 TaxID=1457173 RepID=A0A014NZZ5_9BURK|nr:hypothetical protein AX13_05000 [Comamonas aquatica DA1877]